MPIGKNAIKRVTNNGYSSVKTSAPDMENSTVSEEKSNVTVEKAVKDKKVSTKKTSQTSKSQTKAAETKKGSEKKVKAPQKSMEKEPDFSPVKTAEKITQKASKKDKGYINIGDDLPYYLL